MSRNVETLARGPWPASAVQISLVPPTDMSDDAAAEIDRLWELELAAAKQENRLLFNGGILYLHQALATPHGLGLALGNADYKTFLITTLRHHAWFARHFPACIRPALGNSALLTCGPDIILGVRSRRVAAYPGMAHLIGGVLENQPAETPAAVANHSLNAGVLLYHLLREIQEELGLITGDLTGTPRVLLLVQDGLLHQPELIWHCEITSSAMHKATHGITAQDRHEHDRILRINLNQATLQSADGIAFTPATEAAIEMLRELNRSSGHQAMA